MAVAHHRPAALLPAVLFLSLGLLPAGAGAQSIDEKAQVCAGCHGESGVPQQKTWPAIWGQQQGYLYLQLRDFKSGARKDDVMSPIAQSLERADMQALALYFSQKPWPNLQQPRPAREVSARAQQVNNSVVCTSCHQAGFLGDSTQPRLAGQSREYLRKSMLDFRTRTRGNNPGMTDFMLAISEQDIADLAALLAGL
jgi:cytochrome c553